MARALAIKSKTTVHMDELNRAIDTFAVKTNRGFNDAFKRAMTGIARRAQAVTPPAGKSAYKSNAGTSTKRPVLTQSDKRRGESALHADLMAIFSGVETNGNRKSKSAALVDIERIHDRIFAKKIPGKRLASDKPGGERYEVDALSLKRLESKLKKNVGLVAAGFNEGLRVMGITPPAWVGNKAGSGTASARLTGLQRRVVITHSDVPERMHGELQRRINWATRAQMAAMQREIKAVSSKFK